MSEVVINSTALNRMTEHLESTYPNEGCGFMLGTDNKRREINELIVVENGKQGDQRRRFAISPLDYLKAERYADEKGLALLGVYHSHPDHPAIPSIHDLKQAVPFFSYVIVSVVKGNAEVITSWQLDDTGKFEEEKLIDEKEVAFIDV